MTSIVNHHVAKSSAFTRVMPIRGSRSTIGYKGGVRQARRGSPTGQPSLFISESSLDRRLEEIEAMHSPVLSRFGSRASVLHSLEVVERTLSDAAAQQIQTTDPIKASQNLFFSSMSFLPALESLAGPLN